MNDTNTGEGESFDEAVRQALLQRKNAGFREDQKAEIVSHTAQLAGGRTDRVWHVVQLRGIK